MTVAARLARFVVEQSWDDLSKRAHSSVRRDSECHETPGHLVGQSAPLRDCLGQQFSQLTVLVDQNPANVVADDRQGEEIAKFPLQPGGLIVLDDHEPAAIRSTRSTRRLL